MGATIHLRLRLVEIARIKGRENLVAVVVSYTQAPSMYFATLTNNKLSIIRQARNIGAIEPRRQRTTSATEKRSRTRVHPCPRRG
jgi:hypothetical protein